jgi:hypothetical protein
VSLLLDAPLGRAAALIGLNWVWPLLCIPAPAKHRLHRPFLLPCVQHKHQLPAVGRGTQDVGLDGEPQPRFHPAGAGIRARVTARAAVHVGSLERGIPVSQTRPA